MLTALHTLIYSDDQDATRAFLRDVLEWPHVQDADSDPGWLIFRTGPSELGVHPTSGTHEGSDYSFARHHSISLMCDDIEATRKELEAKGASFLGPIEDQGFGLATSMELPGADPVMLYEPRHATAYDLT